MHSSAGIISVMHEEEYFLAISSEVLYPVTTSWGLLFPRWIWEISLSGHRMQLSALSG